MQIFLMADSFIVIDRDTSGKTTFHPEPRGNMIVPASLRNRMMRLVERDLDRFLCSKLQANDDLEPSILEMAEWNQPALLETFYEWVVKEFPW